MSADQFELNCSVRADSGKGASRRLRRLDNAIPAILYGGNKDPMALTIAHDDILHATENEAFFSHIITLNIGKDKEKAVVKALQRHPAKRLIMHADFLRVDEKQAITMKVPLHFINEDKCVGVKLGSGSIRKTLNELEISCLPNNLPQYIEVDMLEVEVGQTLHISDIALPEGVTSVALSHGEDSDLSIAQVQAPRGGGDDDSLDATVEGDGDTAADGSGDSAS
ncbi:MAG: 50S ribosomal protein L25/general stress protein Ctc [Pseudomonadota bacterium]|nr:50S ribosomal protein L25/general stress protein Ctc [Pseudomonadota bacterium]